MNTYVWSKNHNRLFKTNFPICFSNQVGADQIPTVLVDINDGGYYFITLLAKRVYNITILDIQNFDYNKYLKNISV